MMAYCQTERGSFNERRVTTFKSLSEILTSGDARQTSGRCGSRDPLKSLESSGGYLRVSWSTSFAARRIECSASVRETDLMGKLQVCAGEEVRWWWWGAEVWEQLVTPRSVWNVWRWILSQEPSVSNKRKEPGQAKTCHHAHCAPLAYRFIREGDLRWLDLAAAQHFVLRLKQINESSCGSNLAYD